MSVGNGMLDSMKGNQMINTEIGSRGLVELVKAKTNLTDIGSYSYALTILWALADDKLKNTVIELIEREGENE